MHALLAYTAPLLAGLAALAAGFSRPITPVAEGVLRPWWDAGYALGLTLVVHTLQGLSPAHVFALFWLGVAAFSDARCGLLPERWTRVGTLIIALGALWQGGMPGFLEAAFWGLSTAALLYGLRLLGYAMQRGAGVGMGDVKLGLGLGMAFSTWALAVVYAAFLVSALFLLVYSASKRRDLAPRSVALGPGFLAGACLFLGLPPPWLEVGFDAVALLWIS